MTIHVWVTALKIEGVFKSTSVNVKQCLNIYNKQLTIFLVITISTLNFFKYDYDLNVYFLIFALLLSVVLYYYYIDIININHVDIPNS